MSAVVALSALLDAQQVWRGRAAPASIGERPAGEQPTGWATLDALLPSGGWPEASLSEILLPLDGVGELQLVLPTLARLSHGKRPVVLVAPPYAPCVAGWRQHGVDMRRVEIVTAAERDVLWATEQCLRSGSCAAVLAWPQQADDRALRRLQVAADSGRALAFAFRDRRHLANASPAALRLELEAAPRAQVWVRKCRGGAVPAQPVPLARTSLALMAGGDVVGLCIAAATGVGWSPPSAARGRPAGAGGRCGAGAQHRGGQPRRAGPAGPLRCLAV